ncbi:hypothetical protein ACFE04_025520 [Oxalis oulophora]
MTSSDTQEALSALDTARIQFYHFQAVIICGMGLFTDAYDLFCMTPIMTLLGRIYYQDSSQIPLTVVAAMVAIAFLGMAIGQLVFGRAGDQMGRRHVFGLSLLLMILSSIGCGFSMCRDRKCVLLSLGFYRFLLGFGIGGDYPLSAVIVSESVNMSKRGAMVASVFSLQGFGILAGAGVTMVVCRVWGHKWKATPDHTPQAADTAWRVILMIGAIPATLTFYWRMFFLQESMRYKVHSMGISSQQAATEAGIVMEVGQQQRSQINGSQVEIDQSPAVQYSLFSKEFMRLHGRDLFSCSISWMLVDIVFYSNNLFQSKIYHHYIFKSNQKMDAYEEVFQVAKLQAIIAGCSTIPGYFATILLVDHPKFGRKNIQKFGFLAMAIVYFVLGISYFFYWGKQTNIGFMLLYGLSFFFANFGPNTTTFIAPAELFTTRFRTTCHGIAGAAGKVGAIIGTVGFLWASPAGNLKDATQDEINRMTVTLLVLGGVCLGGFWVTKQFMRDNTGKSLEDNEIYDHQH